MTGRLAVLCSGRGSNLQAVLDACAEGSLDAEVVGVFSDQPGCAALERVGSARRWSRRVREFPSRTAFDSALGDAIAAADPDWVVCAGYMRILGDAFVARFRGRLINIHPSLLPEFRGLHTHAEALAARAAEHGATVHFVSEELDGGPLIAQSVVPVLPGDTAETLAARVLEVEHPLLVEVLRWAVAGRLSECGGHAELDGHPLFKPRRLEFAHAST